MRRIALRLTALGVILQFTSCTVTYRGGTVGTASVGGLWGGTPAVPTAGQPFTPGAPPRMGPGSAFAGGGGP